MPQMQRLTNHCQLCYKKLMRERKSAAKKRVLALPADTLFTCRICGKITLVAEMMPGDISQCLICYNRRARERRRSANQSLTDRTKRWNKSALCVRTSETLGTTFVRQCGSCLVDFEMKEHLWCVLSTCTSGEIGHDRDTCGGRTWTICIVCNRAATDKFNAEQGSNLRPNVFADMSYFFDARQKVASKNASSRLDKGRTEAGQYTLSPGFLLRRWIQQQGRCHYSNLIMQFEHARPFFVSVERLNPSLGYNENQTVLICAEFNGSTQMTMAKIGALPELVTTPIDVAHQAILIAQARIARTHATHESDEIRTKVHRLITSCWANTETRLKGGPTSKFAHIDNSDGSFNPTLTHDQVYDKLLTQQGRCFYSDVPLKFAPKSDWLTSIERVDEMKPYTAENTVLVVHEFNTVAQWTRDKFQLALESIKVKYGAVATANTAIDQ
jgi:hypothetical protein